ncbi:hypothetical protein BGZ97_009354, partial [Linnemannia gamsii]
AIKLEKSKAKFVDESAYIWPSNGKAHTKDGTGAYNAELWNKILNLIKDANVGAPQLTTMMNLFNCRIHQTGASYHFHRNASIPCSKRKLADYKKRIQEPAVETLLKELNYVVSEKVSKV